ncbi:hypothetical protein J1614_009826 [Plenodomus biglobosus]|nr:hypothetical protein J1614_009826 [Plenodomus biglobosus]
MRSGMEGPTNADTGCHVPLPKYYLNAEALLRQASPKLFQGEGMTETVSKAPAITRHFQGPLAHWDNFQEEAMNFFKDDKTQSAFKSCSRAPIYMSSTVEALNSKAMTHERLQVGAEISLSGRFSWNALAVVTHVVETLISSEHSQDAQIDFLPREIVFGDSWTIRKEFRVEGHEPDVILKLPLATGHQVRLTVFLNVGTRSDGEPCVYFSDIIFSNNSMNTKHEDVTLRAAMFYMVHLTCSSPDWEMPREIYDNTRQWIKTAGKSYQGLVTPYGNRMFPVSGHMPQSPLQNTVPASSATSENTTWIPSPVNRQPGAATRDFGLRSGSYTRPATSRAQKNSQTLFGKSDEEDKSEKKKNVASE